MKSIIIKSTIGTLSVGGLATGSYYGWQAFNKEPTIKDLLVAKNLTLFEMSDVSAWQTKFDTFRKDDNKLPKLSTALKEGKASFEVSKERDNADGGQELKNWCEAVFKLKKSEAKGNKTLDNAEILCSEPKANR
ncbi:hypothetical protein A6V39_00435 [Candidatus Mycoplasma haematobovis]|uniref:Uncharacterized protein n=1 Tax=Candidatus Mycoplasma haematobovis TaxID=432608 RepID=A0A1A9QDF9_9MOLU|nr:hypothetical protein [Candidatus Mycoplasma haematobovis]OAL10517.1 hypothetical protein A6V39_00435 [Candidatus Mycoplasma haematobovis]